MKGITYEASRNQWMVQLTVEGSRIKKRFKTESEAILFLENAKLKIAMGKPVNPKEYTVGEWTTEFLEKYKKKDLRPKSYLVLVQVQKHLEPIKDILIKNLKASTVDDLLVNLHKSTSTIKKVYLLLKSALAKAKTLGLVDFNVMDDIEPPQQHQDEVEIYSDDELKRIRDFLTNDKYYAKYFPLFIVAIQTGARLGEILGLKIKSVHQDYLTINNNLQFIEGELLDTPPKTESSYRKIPINPETYSIITAHIGARKNGYVFSTENGTPYHPNNINRMWTNVLKGASVTHKRFHALRHTFASNMLTKGIPIANVSQVLGHASVDITLRFYTHALIHFDKEIAVQARSFLA